MQLAPFLFPAARFTNDTAAALTAMPCAVCQAASAAAQFSVVLPGFTACPATHTLDYGGYILAGNSARTSFICVDSSPVPGPAAAGSLAGYVEFVGGSPANVIATAGYELACVQCTTTGTVSSASVHHGLSTCPSPSTLLYAGSAMSTASPSAAGGADYLCVPAAPQFRAVLAGVQSDGSAIAGADYALAGTGIHMLAALGITQAACVVYARPNTTTSAVAIPATPASPPDTAWAGRRPSCPAATAIPGRSMSWWMWLRQPRPTRHRPRLRWLWWRCSLAAAGPLRRHTAMRRGWSSPPLSARVRRCLCCGNAWRVLFVLPS